MDLQQQIALILLLTMVAYLIMVNVFKDNTIKSEGTLSDTFNSDDSNIPSISSIPSSPELISNKLDLEKGTTANSHALYNENATGILPQNHDLFEKPADFGSDVTNINQFYRNNPELFHKQSQAGTAYVPNPSAWDEQAKDMFNTRVNEAQGPIQPFNFEQGPNAPQL